MSRRRRRRHYVSFARWITRREFAEAKRRHRQPTTTNQIVGRAEQAREATVAGDAANKVMKI